MAKGASNQTKTIPEFLAEHPDVDQRETWARCWGVLSDLKARVDERFETQPHHSSAHLAEWQAGSFEGSLNTFTGPEAEWVVHSWIGNRSSSILDMNLQVWLGPHIDAPHLCLVFGTVPQIYHYSDLVPRYDLTTNLEHLAKYYEAENEPFLEWRGDDRFTWSVSHGSYMRAILSPAAYSFMDTEEAPVMDDVMDRVVARFDRWMAMVDQADAVPESEQGAMQERDHLMREYMYKLDPMNELAKKFMDEETVASLIDVRHGKVQLEESRAGSDAK